jgi:hypothetical protein
MTIRQLSAGANQCRQPKLDLMPVRMPLDADVTEDYCNIFPITYAQGNAFIGNRAVALRPLHGVTEPFGGRHDIIEQSDLSKIKVAGKMKSKKIILHRGCGKIQKPDLALHLEARAAIFNLLLGQAGFRQQRRQLDPRLSQGCTGVPAYSSRGARERAEPLETTTAQAFYPVLPSADELFAPI